MVNDENEPIPEYEIDVRILNNLLNVAKMVSHEIIINFDESGMSTLFVDTAHIQMCEITVPKSVFVDIRNPQPVSIGVNIFNLSAYISRLCKSRKLVGDTTKLKIGEKLMVVSGKKQKSTSRKLVKDDNKSAIHDTKSFTLLDTSNLGSQKLPDLKLTTEINDISQPILKRAIAECSHITDYFELITKNGKSKIYVETDIEEYDCPIGTTEDEDAKSMYAADMFTDRISKIVDSHSAKSILIDFRYAVDYPLMMTWQNHGVKFMIFTAPRIEA